MKHLLNIIIVFLCIHLSAQKDSVYYGQQTPGKRENKEKRPNSFDFKDKIFYGGNFDVYFINSTTVISLNPLVGLKVTDKFQIGAGGVFNYFSTRYAGQTVNSIFYGSHTFARYFVLDNVFAQVQYDRIFQPKINFSKNRIENGWMDYVLIGGGFRQPIGTNAYFITSLMYNVNYNPNQINAYYNPLIQVGIVGGF